MNVEQKLPALKVIVTDLDITLGSMIYLLIKLYLAAFVVMTMFTSLFLVFGFVLLFILGVLGAALSVPTS